jgi:hypothetical protein
MLAAFSRRPLPGRQGVLVLGRELGFRRQPVVDRDHHRVGLLGQAAGAAVVHLLAGDDPAAAVVVHDHRERSLALGRVDAHGQLAGRAGNGAVGAGDAGHQLLGAGVLALLLEHGHHGIGRRGLLARFGRLQRLDRLGLHGGQRIQHLLHVGVGLVLGAGLGGRVVLGNGLHREGAGRQRERGEGEGGSGKECSGHGVFERWLG